VFVLPEKCFKFDSVFNEDSSQDHLYRQVVDPIVNSFVTGNTCSILAYGQTGAGKTFTMGTSTAKVSRRLLF
jgi:excinuclease UvrABC helicase subunit UvrB